MILPSMDLYSVLEANGYNSYSMPDRDFVPLVVVWMNPNKKFERIGMLPRFVSFPANMLQRSQPVVLPPKPKPIFSSIRTALIDASFGLNFLKNIFAQMGVADFSTKIKFSKVNKIEISYSNVMSDSVDPVDIAAYIDAPATPAESQMIASQLRPTEHLSSGIS